MSAEEVNITPPLKTTPHALETTACPDTGKLGLFFFFSVSDCSRTYSRKSIHAN